MVTIQVRRVPKLLDLLNTTCRAAAIENRVEDYKFWSEERFAV